MTTTTANAFALPESAPAAARTVFRLLRRLAVGTLDVQLPDGSLAHFGTGREGEPRASMRMLDWSVCSATLKSGDIGFAEAYLDGLWTSPDVVALLQLFIANREAVEDAIYGRWWGSLLHRFKHLLNRNSRRGSRKNIHAHYDLGNTFYRLWLDETMNYSSAWFDGDTSKPMPEAQRAKVRRALRECGVRAGDRVLEIGCGWGAVAEAATNEFGARVTGVTLSTEQLAYARERLARLGLGTQADLRLQDYRDIQDGPFDAVVSIEMFEAVGREYWGSYFRTVRDRLKPGGRACIQSITIRDDLFARYLRSTDFIQQYVFPGGLLPSASAFRAEARKAGLEVVGELAFGADYAETLRRWRVAFLAQENTVRAQGFDTRFVRIWEFYLAYCEAAFATGNTDVVQFTLRRT
ncbi:SAM-dependent methyltransferase [Rubrivivax gelatinosus]|uniref:Cyclopropane-fatty-acyl-phospholipid synthase Cfa n=1 Tax=Rubrivivax gelatinosus (strain NBRC 100245 / IL144) TaxID=983917 RepID=I0HXU1_RUBGI|nr:cyclopropane-fatty-acyl-phospholipid synthase family protein [Rubrivivax gelatinosus]BAL97828.1 cyclopropane-fatty-acyl-phospholipid synthase Cfa [Rubrivivax gelatinosus IL144]